MAGTTNNMTVTDTDINDIIAENDRRNNRIFAPFDPITGRGSVGPRVRVLIADFIIPEQWLPADMMDIPFIQQLARAGSINAFLADVLHVEPNDVDFSKVTQKIIRLRNRHDFPFWAATLCKIHNKDAGVDVLFRLRYPQRILVSRFEEKRRAGLPIRLILLKARQWGGSTTTQLYMMWLQLMHRRGLNSLIIAHQGTASDEIKDMFDTMIKEYPAELLHKMGDPFSPDACRNATAKSKSARPSGPTAVAAALTRSSTSPRLAFGKRRRANPPRTSCARLARVFSCARSQ